MNPYVFFTLLVLISYSFWLRRKISKDCEFLSKSILKNRALISKQRSKITKLEHRVWELEGHSPEETLAHLSEKIEEWGNNPFGEKS